ncbi:MAG: GAF domain-containing protein [Chloroflexia bacterium]
MVGDWSENAARRGDRGEDDGSVSRDQEEIRRLRRLIEGDKAADGLYRALVLASSAGTMASTTRHTRVLESIVETAAQVIRAGAGALFLLDRDTEELIFEVAIGGKAEEVKKFRVPVGHGIAGLVAVTGQPMAVSNADQDIRRAEDIQRAVDYVPKTILCMPLFYEGEVIGVLELLDKEGGAAFNAADIELLGLFANQASAALEMSRVNTDLNALILQLLRGASGAEEEARLISEAIGEMPALRGALELAGLIQQIAGYGEEGIALCRTVLAGFLEYLRGRPQVLAE